MTLILHNLDRSRSRSVMLLLEELELEYETKEYKRDPRTFRAPLSLREVHPLGKVPLVTDGDRVMAETGFIIAELLETYGNGRLVPEPGTQAARDYRYFMHYAEGSLMSPLLMRLIFDKIAATKAPFFIRPIIRGLVKKVEQSFITAEIELHTEYLNNILANRTWFTGDAYTGADIMMNFAVEALVERGRQPESKTTHLRAWVGRMKQRPAYQRTVAKAGGVH